MQTSPPDLTAVLLIGTGVVVAFLVFLFLMIVLSQRRKINYEVELRTLQAAKQQELFKAVFEAQEGERQRLAADLHDSVGQVLSVIKLNLHRLQKMETHTSGPAAPREKLLVETSVLAEDCMNEIRHIIRNILPPLLLDYGLREALHHLAQKLAAATGLEIGFRAEEGVGRYAREVEITLYRVAQELFNNALKYSQATRIQVSVQQESSELLLTFTDNGIGFRPEQVTPGLGLKNLESRVALLHGQIQMEPAPAGGTRTRIRVQATRLEPEPGQ